MNATIKSITYLGQNRPSIRKLKIELSNGRTIKAQKCHESWEQWGGSQDELRLTMPTVEANNEWLHGGAEPAEPAQRRLAMGRTADAGRNEPEANEREIKI